MFLYYPPPNTLTDAEIGPRIIPVGDAFDPPPGSCEGCAGIRFIWLDKQYLCPRCKGTGKEPVAEEQKDAA